MKEINNDPKRFSEQLNNFSQDGDLNLLEIWNSVFRRKKFVGVFTALFFLVALFYSVYRRYYYPIYKGSFSIMIKDPFENGSGLDVSVLGDNLTNENDKSSENTLIYFLKSEAVLNPFLEKYNLKKLNIDISQKKLTNRKFAKGILDVTAKFKSKTGGTTILSNLSKYYVDLAVEKRTTNLIEGINFLNSQIPKVRENQLFLQNKLSEFSSKNLIADPIAERSVLSQKKALLIEEKENTILDKKKLLDYKQRLNEGGNPNLLFTELYDSGRGTSNSQYQPIVLLQNAESELEIAKSTFKPNSKIVISLEARVLKLKKNALDAAINLSENRLDLIETKINDFENEFKKLNNFVKEYEPIYKELLVRDKEIIEILEVRNNLELSLAQKSNEWAIVSNPKISENPISPSFPKNLSLSIFFGLIIGSFISLLRDRLDYVYHSVDEVKDFLKIPHLSHIPYVRIFKEVRDTKISILDFISNESDLKLDGKENKNEKFERFFYQEAFRNLYTSIRFLNTEKKIKTIVFTSSLPAEGKSLTNILFAKTLSDLGKKVLLIDGDLRKPTLHIKLGLNNLKGLSNILADDEISISKVIQKVPGNKNFSIITAGILPPDPTRLLSSTRMRDIIQDVENNLDFDYILFDTPPVSAMSDAILISEYASGMILLVNLYGTNKRIPLETLNRIRGSNTPVLGCVTNILQEKNINNSGIYGYSYYSYKSYEAYSDYVIDEEKDKDFVGNNKFSQISKKINLVAKNLLEWIDK